MIFARAIKIKTKRYNLTSIRLAYVAKRKTISIGVDAGKRHPHSLPVVNVHRSKF